MEKRILQVRKLSDALRVRLKELKKSDADLLLNLDEEELLDMYKVTQLAYYCTIMDIYNIFGLRLCINDGGLQYL